MKNLITLILIFFGAETMAQPFVDVLNVQTQQYGSSKNKTKEYTGNLFLPLEMKNSDDIILLGASYNKLVFENVETENSKGLTSVSTQLGGIKKWNEDWSTMAIVIPKVNSDMIDVSSKDVQLGGAALMIKTVSKDFKYKLGMYYNREFFGNFMVPLLGIEWRATQNLQIFGVLPGSMNIEYKLSNKCYTGISYKSITTSYRLANNEKRNFVRDGHTFWGHNQLKTFFNYYPTKNIMLYTELGHTAFRQFNIFENNNKEKLDQLDGVTDNLFVNVGASFRIRLDQ